MSEVIKMKFPDQPNDLSIEIMDGYAKYYINKSQISGREFQANFEDVESQKARIECYELLRPGFYSFSSTEQGNKTIQLMVCEDNSVSFLLCKNNKTSFYSRPAASDQMRVKGNIKKMMNKPSEWSYEFTALEDEHECPPLFCFYCFQFTTEEECPECCDDVDTIEGIISK